MELKELVTHLVDEYEVQNQCRVNRSHALQNQRKVLKDLLTMRGTDHPPLPDAFLEVFTPLLHMCVFVPSLSHTDTVLSGANYTIPCISVYREWISCYSKNLFPTCTNILN